MRRLSGEKTGSKAGLLKNSAVLILLFSSVLTYSQIPINGFCSQINYSIPKGYDAVISSDLNSDGNDELIFYSALSKRVGVYSGLPGDNGSIKEFRIDLEISQLRQLKEKSANSRLFAAIDRKHRKIVFIDISPDGINKRNKEIEFDSYPESIFTGDINLDGREEILVYGSGFDGLSILSRSDEGVGEKKIITGTSFSEAIFIDFNNDGYLDIAAFNILENALQFFTNNTKGIFRFNRSIQYSDKIILLKTRDLNNDELSDLIYSIGRNIEILFGDFQHTYKTKKTIKLDERPIAIIFGDFNNDKLLDISYSLLSGTLNILYTKEDFDFYESITYLKMAQAGSIAKFKSYSYDNIVSFLKPDEICVLTTAKDLNRDFKVVPAIHASTIKKFDFGNDSFPDFCFVDKYDKFLKLYTLNKAGVPVSFYYFPLAEDHEEIVVDDFYKQIKTFYCYSQGTPLLEVFKYNFKTNKLNRKQLYAPGEILNLNIQRVDSLLVNVFIVYNKQSKLHLGKFENRDQSITFKEYPFIDRNVSLAKIRIQSEPEVFYWKVERDTFFFKKVDIEPGPNLYSSYYRMPASEKLNIKLYGANLYFNSYPSIISMAQSESEKHLFLITGSALSFSSKFFNDVNITSSEFGRGKFGEINSKGIINFSVNTPGDDYINTLIFSEKDNGYLLSRTISASNVSDYFFLPIDQKNYYLVYSNQEGDLLITSAKK